MVNGQQSMVKDTQWARIQSGGNPGAPHWKQGEDQQDLEEMDESSHWSNAKDDHLQEQLTKDGATLDLRTGQCLKESMDWNRFNLIFATLHYH